MTDSSDSGAEGLEENEMADPKDDGGPAFPRPTELDQWDRALQAAVRHHEPGMSLRDYFAGQALAGLLSAPESDGEYPDCAGPQARIMPDKAAAWSYEFADAMLKERGRE